MRKISTLPRKSKKRSDLIRVRREADRAAFGAGGYEPHVSPPLSSLLEIPQGRGEPTINQKTDATELDCLYGALSQVTAAANPRTFKLLGATNRKIAQKVIEEAGEVALAAIRHRNRGVIRESADLLYHLTILWRRAGIEPSQIWEEMRQRASVFGLAEKLPKSSERPSRFRQSPASTP